MNFCLALWVTLIGEFDESATENFFLWVFSGKKKSDESFNCDKKRLENSSLK